MVVTSLDIRVDWDTPKENARERVRIKGGGGELRKEGWVSEVSHRPQGGCCTLQGRHHNAELPLHLSPGRRSWVCVHGPGTGIGQAWECGYGASTGCPEHMANRRNRRGSGSFKGQKWGSFILKQAELIHS